MSGELRAAIDAAMQNGGTVPLGRSVLCDWCDEDWTERSESGGFLFQSKATCPTCAPKMEKRIKGYGEEQFIRARCPEGVSFADWVRGMRGPDHSGTSRRPTVNRSPMPTRRVTLQRAVPLQRGTGLEGGGVLERRTQLRPVSKKRQAENRERRKMIDALWPERPECFVPWCTDLADDVHEPWTRARGGSITNPENAVPLCRHHHDDITFTPESELGWAYELGLLVHSWDAGRGGEAA